MMRSLKDSLAAQHGRELRILTLGGKLRVLTNRARLAGNAYMHATTAVGPAFTTAILPANQKGMIPLAGADVAFIGIVRVDVQQPQHTSELSF